MYGIYLERYMQTLYHSFSLQPLSYYPSQIHSLSTFILCRVAVSDAKAILWARLCYSKIALSDVTTTLSKFPRCSARKECSRVTFYQFSGISHEQKVVSFLSRIVDMLR